MFRFSVSPPAPEMSRGRLPGVEALRGLAILMVVMYHAGGVLVLPDTYHGEIGVDIFLLLSGYLLSYSSCELPAGDFLRRRFFRIFPAYWMALTLFVVLGTALLQRTFGARDVLLHLLGVHALFHHAYFSDINDSFWFISTILCLYLVFLVLRRRARDLLLVLGLAGLTTLLGLLPDPEARNLSGRLLGFYLGICLGQLRRGGEFRLQPGIIFAAGAASFAYLEWFGRTSVVYPLAAVAVTAVFALLYRALRAWRGGRLFLAPLEIVGVYSYEIYLFHQPLIREYNFWFQHRLLQREPTPRQLVAGMVIGFALTVGVSVAVVGITRRRRLQTWVLAGAAAALLALAAGAGPFLAREVDRFVLWAQVTPPPRVAPVVPGSDWPTVAPGNPALAGWSGPLRLVAELPARLGAPSEPLIVTGRTGQGDLLGVIRVDARHLRFTCDHWGRYSLTSAVVPIGEGRQHVIEVLLGSLLPNPDSPWYAAHEKFRPLARRLYVAVDGHEAFNRDTDFYPALPTEAFVGIDPLGGSTTLPRFSGLILQIESLDPRRALAADRTAAGENPGR